MKIIKFKNSVEVHFLKEGKDTNNELSVFKCIITPNARTPMPHYHSGFDETVYGVKGVVSWTVDGKTTELGPGDSLFIPRGIVHSFSNNTDETIEFLCHVSPGIFGFEYFEDISKVLNVEGIPDFEKLKTVMKSHGLIPVLGIKRQLIFAILGVIRKIKN